MARGKGLPQAPDGTLTRHKSGLNNWKLGQDSQVQPHPPRKTVTTSTPRCPECASQKLWKDGLRYPRSSQGKPIQRWLCRTCGYRFSQPNVKLNITSKLVKTFHSRKNSHKDRIISRTSPIEEASNGLSFFNSEDIRSHGNSNLTVIEKELNSLPFYNSKRRVCVSEREAKNLAEEATRQEVAQRESTTQPAKKPDPATIKGKLVEFAWYLKKEGYPESTYKYSVVHIKRLVDLGANLWDPENVKKVLAEQSWSDGYKKNIVYSYENFMKMEGLTNSQGRPAWKRPRYKQQDKIYFIPLESELDQLIASSGKVLGTFLQGLKDTGADPGELARLQWIDINKHNRTVYIKHPVKGHNPRILTVSQEFINRLEMLPKKGDRIFSYKYLISAFYRHRKRAAKKLANPRLNKISFTTFRHWKGTMEYHKTKDPYHVKKLLGHKSLKSTEVYINLEQAIFKETNDEYYVRVATTPEEACKLAEVGFDKFDEFDGIHLYRKRK